MDVNDSYDDEDEMDQDSDSGKIDKKKVRLGFILNQQKLITRKSFA